MLNLGRRKPAERKRTTGTPRPWTFKIYRGRSPGSQVIAAVWPSQRSMAPVALLDSNSLLTVAGAAPALRTRSPASLLASKPKTDSEEPRRLYLVWMTTPLSINGERKFQTSEGLLELCSDRSHSLDRLSGDLETLHDQGTNKQTTIEAIALAIINPSDLLMLAVGANPRISRRSRRIGETAATGRH